MFLEKAEAPGKKVRLFCLGQEIQDGVPLYKYNLQNDFVCISFLTG